MSDAPTGQAPQPTPAENTRLAAQRKAFFDEFDKNSSLRKLVIQAILAEGGIRGLQANLEQMCNYANARGFTSLSQAVHSGFYGPVNRGEAQRHTPTSKELAAADAAILKVRGGSNLIDYRTDQGSPGDPNFYKEKHNPAFRMKNIDGCWFADHPMFMTRDGGSWAQSQEILDKQGGIPTG